MEAMRARQVLEVAARHEFSLIMGSLLFRRLQWPALSNVACQAGNFPGSGPR